MRKKSFLAITLSALIGASMFSLAGCGGNATPKNTDVYDIPQDYCRTYYEVFVRSFADSDNDGIGDIRGLIDNLDYLNDGDDSTTTDLGINGIWMMPINKANSYHKYDVTDYYDIDEEYGTLDDFKDLVKACDERNIWIQMDLVLNHTSNAHPDFAKALKEAKSGVSLEDGEYMSKYVFADKNESVTGKWHNVSGSDYKYLGNFNDGMPDVNLQNPEVREEIKKIVDYWLELGVRSFRLDAVPWACNDSVSMNEENEEFWTWFNDYCNEAGAKVYAARYPDLPRYCYNVGEVLIGSQSTIKSFYSTGMSNFSYSLGGNADADIPYTINGNYDNGISTLVKSIQSVQDDLLDADKKSGMPLLSNFLSNHDNDRSAGYFARKPERIKRAAGMYLLAPGNPYIYYGEEIGAVGNGRDENKRLAFNWGDKKHKKVDNPSNADYTGEQELGSVASQTKDANSILTYYRRAIAIRNRFPEIGRGIMTSYAIDGSGKLVKMSDIDSDGLASVNALNKSVAAYTLTWKDRTVLIIHNVGNATAEFSASDFADWTTVATLSAEKGKAEFENGSARLEAGSVAVIKKI